MYRAGHRGADAHAAAWARTAAASTTTWARRSWRPVAPWAAIAFARDWVGPPRLQNAPSWHYVHSDQWRYEAEFTEYHPVPPASASARAKGHTVDLQVKAVRSGWLPVLPAVQPSSSIEVVKEARAAGAKTEAEVVATTRRAPRRRAS